MVSLILALVMGLLGAPGDPILTCYAYEDLSWSCYHAGDRPAPAFEGYPLNPTRPVFVGPQSRVGPAHATWEANHG